MAICDGLLPSPVSPPVDLHHYLAQKPVSNRVHTCLHHSHGALWQYYHVVPDHNLIQLVSLSLQQQLGYVPDRSLTVLWMTLHGPGTNPLHRFHVAICLVYRRVQALISRFCC